MQHSALVCIENGYVDLASQMLTKARTLALDVYAFAFSSSDITIAEQYGANKVFYCELSDALSIRYASAIEKVIRNCSPDIVLLPATPLFKSVSSRLAARFGCGLTADCIDLYIGNDNLLYQVAPAFSSNAMATILIPRTRPQMVSVLEGIADAVEKPVKSQILEVKTNDLQAYKMLSETVKNASRSNDSIILSAGYGIGSREGFEKMCQLASYFGAGIGATMSAVDAGYAPRSFLIGQTGMIVSPRVYVAFGISGQIQHLIGMRGSGCIVSVNKDQLAPLNGYADYFLEGDCNKVIEQMLENFNEKR